MQNPPPGQESYGSSQGMPPPAPPQEKTSTGIDANVAAAISYIWIVGLIFFFIEKENRFVRFHAMQSVLFGVVWSVVMIVLVIVGMIFTFIGVAIAATAGDMIGTLFNLLVGLIWLLIWLVPLGMFIALILTAIKAFQGKIVKLPIIGNMAEKIVDK
ncbi:MAG: hypothetical protein ABJB97_00095 [Acidobacteriota bacterium]